MRKMYGVPQFLLRVTVTRPPRPLRHGDWPSFSLARAGPGRDQLRLGVSCTVTIASATHCSLAGEGLPCCTAVPAECGPDSDAALYMKGPDAGNFNVTHQL
jgi:hypothetical protein